MRQALNWIFESARLLCGVAALAILCYWPVLQGLASEWYHDEDMGHGFLVPLAAGWIAWLQRKRLAVMRPSAWGPVLVLAGAALQFLGASAVPVAILVNALRVAAVAVICRYNYPLAVGAFHDASGWAALALALVLLAGTERAIRHLPASAARQEPQPAPSPVVRPVWLVGVALILVAQLVPLCAAPLLESPPRLPPLSQFPEKVGAWRMTRAETPPASELAELSADDLLLRFYADPAGGSGDVELRVAYHRSQRAHGRLPHSPRVCLPANGWTPIESRIIKIRGGEVNLYVASKGGERATVLYWYQTPWQSTASEWRTRAWLAANGILQRRTDVALVQLVVSETGDHGKGLEAALGFAPLVMSKMRARLH